MYLNVDNKYGMYNFYTGGFFIIIIIHCQTNVIMYSCGQYENNNVKH